MDNIIEREEFLKNTNFDITDRSQPEVLAINGMRDLISIPMEHRLYILATMQNALRIDFEEYQDYYSNEWLPKMDNFKDK